MTTEQYINSILGLLTEAVAKTAQRVCSTKLAHITAAYTGAVDAESAKAEFESARVVHGHILDAIEKIERERRKVLDKPV